MLIALMAVGAFFAGGKQDVSMVGCRYKSGFEIGKSGLIALEVIDSKEAST